MMGPAGGLLGTWSLLSPSALRNQLPTSEGLRDKRLSQLWKPCAQILKKPFLLYAPWLVQRSAPVLSSLQTP